MPLDERGDVSPKGCDAAIDAAPDLLIGKERWFAELTRKQIQRGVHTSVRQLEADIRAFIELHNKNPKPFKWTKSADQILASVKRFCHKAQQTLCDEL